MFIQFTRRSDVPGFVAVGKSTRVRGCYLCNSKSSRGHLDHTLAYTRDETDWRFSTQEIGTLAGLGGTICETCPETT